MGQGVRSSLASSAAFLLSNCQRLRAGEQVEVKTLQSLVAELEDFLEPFLGRCLGALLPHLFASLAESRRRGEGEVAQQWVCAAELVGLVQQRFRHLGLAGLKCLLALAQLLLAARAQV